MSDALRGDWGAATTITDDPEDDGSMDDLFIKGGIESVHVERMDRHVWWAAVYLADGSRVTLHWRAPSGKRVDGRWEHEA